MNTILKSFLLKFFNPLKPLIRSIANHADIKLNYPYTALGQHSLIFEDIEDINNKIPKSVIFNTRSGKIFVGKNTMFGEEVMVLTGKHKFLSEIDSEQDLHEVPENGRDIIIGKNCYIGSGAILIGPLSIGDYAVIGAGAVVTKDVPSKTMFGGIPAKLIKELKLKDE